MSTTYADGSAGAAAGTKLLAGLLSGYTTRPPWLVAGVDYAVGVPAGTTLADPSTISMAGVSVNAATHTVTITGSNVTLNGYNFGLDGGWGVVIAASAANTAIENSNFQVGANNLVPVTAAVGSGSLTLQHDAFDGGGGQNSKIFALVSYDGTGTFTAQWNSFTNAPADAIDFSDGTMTTIVRYNVFDNLGTTSGSHPDSVQYVAVQGSNDVIAFNTVYQPNPSGMEGIQVEAQNGSVLTNTTVDNNTIVAKAGGLEMSYSIAILQASGNTINGATVDDNYIDSSGAYGAFYPPAGSSDSFAGNVSLTTGALLASPVTGIANAVVTGLLCFAAGTRIATAGGERRVEALRLGELVATAHGPPRPIVWIGRRALDCRRHPRPDEVWPVEVAPHAFGPGLPRRPLLLSPDHAVFAEGVLVPIKVLVNGMTITRRRVARIEYFHVQLDRHDIILADGLPVESYLDAGARGSFDGLGATPVLHPDFASRAWEAEGCAPLAVTGLPVDALRDRLAAGTVRERPARPPSPCDFNRMKVRAR